MLNVQHGRSFISGYRRSVVSSLFSSLIAVLIFLLLWQLVVTMSGVASFIFPTPLEIYRSFVSGLQRGIYPRHLEATIEALCIGYFTGSVVGLVLGLLIAEVKIFEKLLYPAIVAIQSMPKVAIAPLFVMWFGYGISSKIVIVVLLCSFPILVNTVAGLRSTERDRIDLIRAMTGTRSDILWHVKLPSAAGHIFAGLQLGVVMALIGVIVAEFVGSDKGLGILLQRSQLNLDTPGMFVVLIFLSLVGIISTAVVKLVQQKVVFWQSSDGQKTQ